MKKTSILRALSMTAALALALSFAGVAETEFEEDEIEIIITAEEVDAPVESGEMDLCDDSELSVGEPEDPPALVTDDMESAPDPLPDDVDMTLDDAVPSEDAVPDEDDVPPEDDVPAEDAPAADDEDVPEAAEDADAPQETPGSAPETAEVPADDPAPAAVEDAAPADLPGDAEAPAPEANTPAPEEQEAPAPDADADAKTTPPALSNAEMADNIRAASLGAKTAALANIAELLMNHGFEPAFAAGVCANVYSEGSYGLFERSGYMGSSEHPDLQYIRPKYFCYLDGGSYYTRGESGYVVTDVYLSPDDMDAYTGAARVHMRYGDENYYLDNWSGRRVWEINLDDLEEFMVQLAGLKLQFGTPDAWVYDKATDTWEYNEAQEGAESWRGKFGLGCVQWTGEEAMKLLAVYRKHAGAGSATITRKQAIAAEHEMILKDLRGRYKKVYDGWKRENGDALDCPEAARSAGSWVCLKYEIPANREAKAISRGKKAAEIYKIMVGEG